MIYILLVLLGLCFGSFVNALVWRLHEKRDFVKERSECVSCHHVLAWYDLIPVVSWLLLKGRCRYCHKHIASQYPLIELLVAGLFVLSYAQWPYGFETIGIILFCLWLISMVAVTALMVYDARYMLLPDSITFPLIVLGILFASLRYIGLEQLSLLRSIYETLLGMASVGGLYYLLYAVSRGAWVGFGDVKLGIFMGAVLGWAGGLLAVALANIIGLLIVAPGLISGKLQRTSRVPFGPMLIAGYIIAGLYGPRIIDWYVGSLLL